MAKQVKRFQYQQRDPSTIKTRSSQRGGDFDSIWKEGIKIYKPREGKNIIRVIPPTWPDASHYGYDLYINYRIGVDEQSYLSLSAMLNKPDPLAEARKEAEKEANKKLADSLKPSKRVAFYLVDRMAEEEGIQAWPSPWTFDKKICALSIDEDTGAVIMIDDPYEGCDVRFYFEKTGKQFPDYPAEKMRILKPSPLSEDEGLMNQWLDFAQDHPIPNMLNFYEYDHIASVFEGHVVKSEGEDETTSKRPKGTPQSGKKPWEDEEDDKPHQTKPKAQLNDKEEYDTETGEITPKSNGKAAAKKPVNEEEDNEAEEAKMSVESIRQRLAGRRPRPTVDDED